MLIKQKDTIIYLYLYGIRAKKKKYYDMYYQMYDTVAELGF